MSDFFRPWPRDAVALEAQQRELAAAADAAPPWAWPAEDGSDEQDAGQASSARNLTVAAAFAAFPRGESGPGRAGQVVVAAAILWRERVLRRSIVSGESGGPYLAGYLALRCGALLEAVVRGLGQRPDVLVIDATGRDHPHRAGLALHLGACLDVPSVGVTNRLLEATHAEPAGAAGSTAPLLLGGELVGYAVSTRAGARPVLAHAAWRTSPEQARDLVLALSGRWRTPLPLWA